MPELPDHVEVVQVDGDPEEALYNKERNSLLHDVLDQLTPRQAKVLRFRCGIGVNSEYTLEEIGNILGVTRERVRQIEAKAMRRIKSPSFSFDLFRGIFYNEPWLWSEAKQKHDKEMAEAAKKRDLKKLRLSRN
jgi:DNA-binding CsgD family transcriptional regulator